MGSSRRVRTIAAATLAGVVVVGSALAVSQPEPKRMTLRLSDLPTHLAVVRNETGRYDAARAAHTDSVPAAAFKAHGYLAGYELDATRHGSPVSAGPFQIISAASVWRNAAGARWSLARTVKSSQAHGFRQLSRARIGAESHLYSYTLQVGDRSFRVYSLAWRDGRVRATVLVAGLPRVVTPQSAIRLARKQEQRIDAELNS